MNIVKQMLIDTLKKRNIYLSRKNHPNDFTILRRISEELIKQAGGVLHIGAHIGQEAEFYFKCGVPVLWFEGDPDVYQILRINIKPFENQKAVCHLLGERNEDSVEFNIASNDGASSSIFTIHETKNLPFTMKNKLILPMRRLDEIVNEKQIENFRHWVIDVQGAELNVLKGAAGLISLCQSLQVEVKNISDYIGGTSWSDIKGFLNSKGFINLWEIEKDAEDSVLFVRINRK